MTLLEAREIISLRTREGLDSNIIEEDIIEAHLNDAHKMLVAEKYYPFYDKTFVFDTSQDSELVSQIDTSSLSLEVRDATYMPVSCNLLIGQDVILVDNKAGNTFDIDSANPANATHKTGDKVRRIYDLLGDFNLTNFKKPIFCSVGGTELSYYDGRGALDDDKYTIVDGFLILPFNSEPRNCVLKFEQEPSELVNDGDEFVIPDIYRSVLIEFVLYKVKLDITPEHAQFHYNEYLRLKSRMGADYSRQTGHTGKHLNSIYFN